MMKKIILSIAIVAILFSCNEEKTSQADQKVNVGIEVFEEAVGSGTYSRDEAPCEVQDLIITATNGDYAPSFLFELVDFGNNGGDPKILEDVACGMNVFTGETTAAKEKVWKVKLIDEMPTESTPGNIYLDDNGDEAFFPFTDLTNRAKYYGKYLTELYPIWAIFKGEKSKMIYFNNTNTVNLNMTSEYGRLNIVFENNCNCKLCLMPSTGYVVPACPPGGTNYTTEGKAMAYILNNETCTDGKEIKFKFQVLDPNWNLGDAIPEGYDPIYDVTDEITATIEKGVNKTILYRYDETLKVPVAVTTTYTPIENKHEGHVVE